MSCALAQTLLFSATMPTQIRKIAKQHMRDPIEVVLTSSQASRFP